MITSYRSQRLACSGLIPGPSYLPSSLLSADVFEKGGGDLFFWSGVTDKLPVDKSRQDKEETFPYGFQAHLHEQEGEYMFQSAPCTLEASTQRWLNGSCAHASKLRTPT